MNVLRHCEERSNLYTIEIASRSLAMTYKRTVYQCVMKYYPITNGSTCFMIKGKKSKKS